MSKNIYLRGKTWWGRVTIRGAEHRKSLETSSRAEAERRCERWIDGLRASTLGDAHGTPFDAAAVFFLEQHCSRLKPRSAERYRVSMRNLLPHFEGQRLGEINATMLRAFENARRGDGVAAGTIRRDLQCLSSIITVFCDEHDLEFANPVQRYLRRRTRQKALVEAPPRTRYLDHDEEARLLATIRARAENDPRRRRVRVRPEIAKSGEERIVPLLTERARTILAQMPQRLRLAGEPDWI